jgi:outer membrane receptor protein involved in Fe transport
MVRNVLRYLTIVPACFVLYTPLVLSQDGNLVLEEIVVTAQKKSETLSETPMTVNVITGDQFSDYAGFELRCRCLGARTG